MFLIRLYSLQSKGANGDLSKSQWLLMFQKIKSWRSCNFMVVGFAIIYDLLCDAVVLHEEYKKNNVFIYMPLRY